MVLIVMLLKRLELAREFTLKLFQIICNLATGIWYKNRQADNFLYLFFRVQTISGTGANHLGGLFLERFYGPWTGKSQSEKIIYISNPTWGKFNFQSTTI